MATRCRNDCGSPENFYFHREQPNMNKSHTKELTQPSSLPCSHRNTATAQAGTSAFEKDCLPEKRGATRLGPS